MITVTAKNCMALPPGRYRIERGLQLLVMKGGGRYWVFRYSIDGRRRDISLGALPTVTIAVARARADQCRKLLADGQDPKAVRDDAKRAAVADETDGELFRDVAAEALETFQRVRRWKSAKHCQQWRNTLAAYAFPVLGDMPVETITRDDVLKALSPIWETKPETATRVRERIEAVLSYAIARDYREAPNPAAWRGNLDTFLPPRGRIKPERHFKALSFDDLRRVFPALYTSDRISLLAIAFGILTASRAQEVLYATWGEIDEDSATWSLPPERTKTGAPHRVPLSRQALDILRRVRTESPDPSALIFPGPRSGRAMAIDTLRTMLRKKSKTDATMHGCRSTFRDWCEEHLIADALAEKALSHSRREKTVRAYQRSDLLEQRRPVMQQWADALMPS